MTDRQEPPRGGDPLDPYADLSDLTGNESIPRLEDPSVPPAAPPRSPLLTGLIVALLLIVVSIAIFQLLRDDATDGSDPSASATTTTVATMTGSTTAGTISPTTSTDDTGITTTAADTPTTTSDVEGPSGFDSYQASGEAIPFNRLQMAVNGLGPVKFGTDAADAIGRLLVSLGPSDEDTGPVVSTGAFGVCKGDLERIVRWGPFVAIIVISSDGSESFAGYRLDFAYAVEGLGSPATELETLSGFKAGQSVVALNEVYEEFDVSFEVVPDLDTTFQLRSARTGNLLLWGPVTSDDSDGIVLGIYAPDACRT